MTLRELRQAYTRLQRKYYAGSGLPAVKSLRFRWASETSYLTLHSELACVVRHPDGWVGIEFHPILKQEWLNRLTTLILLHEMAHLRNPKAEHGPWFEEEAVRLGAAGAMREFWV